MRVVLRRSLHCLYGQDYRAAITVERLGLSAAVKEGGKYRLPVELDHISLVISFNCDMESDAALITSLPSSIPVVVHVQLQPGLLDTSSFERMSECVRRASRVVVPASFMVEAVGQAFGKSSVTQVRNGVDPLVFEPASDADRDRFRIDRGIPAGGKAVAYVGRLTPAKGIQVLRLIARSLADSTYLIVRCPAADEVTLRELIDLNRNVRGELENHGDRGHLPSRFADTLITTSLSEVAPMVWLESLASGVPVIASASTPFATELRGDGLGRHDICIVGEIPTRLARLPHDELELAPQEAEWLANEMLAALAAVSTPSYQERVERSARLREAGYSVEEMLEGYRHVYDHVDPSLPAV